MNIRRNVLAGWLVALSILLPGCGSSDLIQNLGANERFELGKQKFESEDYIEATSHFEIVKLQFPGSDVADDAQLFLGECHYNQGEFLVAAEDYRALKRNMPASSLVPDAQFKIAMCYYQLTPSSNLDQSSGEKAIDEFQAFIEYYPVHPLAVDAGARIQELNTRLARKLYDTALQYLKMDYFKSASIYFESVVNKYHDTEFAEPSLFGKARALFARKRYQEAKDELEKFTLKYPHSALQSEAASLHRDIEAQMESESNSLGPNKLSTIDHN